MAHPHLFGLLYDQKIPLQEATVPQWQSTKWPNPFEERAINMPKNFGFYNVYSLLSSLTFLTPVNDYVGPSILMDVELHSRNLTPEYREFIFNNIATFDLIYASIEEDYREKEYLVNKALKQLISLNLYNKSVGKPYTLPTKLSSKWNELYDYFVDMHNILNKTKHGS